MECFGILYVCIICFCIFSDLTNPNFLQDVMINVIINTVISSHHQCVIFISVIMLTNRAYVVSNAVLGKCYIYYVFVHIGVATIAVYVFLCIPLQWIVKIQLLTKCFCT